jgi:hypothetical protein
MKKILAMITVMMGLSVPFASAGAETNKTAMPAGGDGQLTIPRIEQMSNYPDKFQVIDWNKMARGFADLAFDLEAKGPDMPLVWLDKSHSNYPEDAFGLYVVVGDPRCGPLRANGTYHDAVCDIGAVFASSLTGLDMTNYKGRNWVKMCRAFFNKSNGRNVFMEHVLEHKRSSGGGYGVDFWYDTIPSVLAMQLGACYPEEESLHEPLRVTCEKFYEASRILLATPEKFSWSTFDFKDMKPKNTWVPKTQQDAAAAFATLLYWAHSRWGDPKYLEASFSCMDYLDALTENPAYDPFQSYAVYIMARANAEHGRHYDVPKHLKWAFQDGHHCVEGVHAGKWGGYDMSGLVQIRGAGRVYLFETFVTAQLLPAVRYDARLARAVGKWMQNAASNARYFYPGYLPKEHMVNPDIGATRGVIASEALTPHSMYGTNYLAPTAETDKWWHSAREPDTGKLVPWPKSIHRSLYGCSYAGIFGAVISRTSDEKVLQLDLLKLDFYRGKAYPTYLFYNPYAEDKDISIDVGDKPVDLYDAVTHAFIKQNVKGVTSLKLMKDSARVVVMAPAAGRRSEDGNKFSVDGVVIDFACPPQKK